MGNLFTARIVLALVFAVAIVVSAFVLKGDPAVEWVQFGLMGLALVFVVLKPSNRATSC